VNGLDPTPPVVNTSGLVNLTLDISPSLWTTPVDWYWALILNGSLFWVTPGGLSATPSPLITAVPGPLTNATLLNLTLPMGTSITNALFLLNGGSVLASDFITANVVAPETP
jgi:hypothetical protein